MVFGPLDIGPIWAVSDEFLGSLWLKHIRRLAQAIADHPELPQLFELPEATPEQRRLCFGLLAWREFLNLLAAEFFDRNDDPPSFQAEADAHLELFSQSDRFTVCGGWVTTYSPDWAVRADRAARDLPFALMAEMPEWVRNEQTEMEPAEFQRLRAEALREEDLERILNSAIEKIWIKLRRLDWQDSRAADSESLDVTGPHPVNPKPLKAHAFRHSPDFHSVRWEGQEFTFTPRQSLVVQLLYEAHSKGVPEVGQNRILEDVGSLEKPTRGRLLKPPTRLRDLFRNHPAWGSLIVQGAKRGNYRLSLPSAKK